MRRANGEGSWHYNPNQERYEYKLRFPEGRKTFSGKTRAICLERYRKYLRKRVEEGIFICDDTPFGAYYEHFLDVQALLVEPTTLFTYRGYRTTLKKSEMDLWSRKFKELTTKWFEEYFVSLQPLFAFTTVKRIKQVLKTVFDLAIKEGYITVNPISSIRLRSGKYVRTRNRTSLTAFEVLRLEEYFNKELTNVKRCLIFIINTGLRAEELLGLRWEDIRDNTLYVRNCRVRAEGGYIDKPPKTLKGNREIPLSNKAMEIIDYFKSLEYRNKKYVFILENKRLPQRESFYYELRKGCRECHLPVISVHELRHTFGSILLANGVDIKIVSDLLGHTDIVTTYNIYIHTSINQLKDAIETLNHM